MPTKNPNAAFMTGTDQAAINGLYQPVSNPAPTTPAPTDASSRWALDTGNPAPTTPAVPSTINSGVLSSSPSLPYAQPRQTPIPALPPMQLTQPETQVDAMSSGIADLNNQLVGKSAYRQQQEQSFGLLDYQKKVDDLTSQMGLLNADAVNLPDQQMLNEAGGNIQAAMNGRPVTREALLRNSIQSHTVAAQLAAYQGKVGYAQKLVDRAVSAKYDPIQEQIDAKTKNLELIMKSPSYSLADKNRAQQQLDVQKQRQDALDKAKLDETNKYKVMTDAATNGATPGVLDAISKAPNADMALQVAANAGFAKKPDPLPTSAQEYEFAVKNGYKGSYTQYQNEDANRKAVIAKAGVGTQGSGGLLDAVMANPTLFSQLTPTVKAALAPALAASGFNAFGKPLSDTAIKAINDTDYALTSLNDLRSKIQGNSDKLGPITGLAALNPWSDARKLQADVDRVRQTVGKALEGGVLRKEDEEKYKKILATLTDTPETAIYKIDALISSVQGNLADYKALQAGAGKTDFTAPSAKPEDLRSKYNY